jgi:hypothetical protein
MSATTLLTRSLQAALAAAIAVFAGSASALEFQIGDETLKVDSLFTIGASWRMQNRDPSLIGKATLYRLQHPESNQGLCYTRVGDDRTNGPQSDAGGPGQGGNIQLAPGAIPEGCSTSSTTQTNGKTPIQAWVARPGSTNPSGDNGNLNFDKGDLVHAVAKFTSDISFSIFDFNLFVRPIYYFDANYTAFETNYPDTTMQDRHQTLPNKTEDLVGSNLEFLDYNISRRFTVFDRDLSVKAGNQVLNWGESSLLVFNSLNSINPLDATKVRFPGADLKEFFQPVGMFVLDAGLIENVSVQAFYQYEWKPLRIDPPGTFFSQSDVLGAGGTYAQNGQGREPDDPDANFRGIDTCNPNCFSGIGTFGSTSSRIVRRNFAEEAKRNPESFDLNSGQYGAKLQLFLEDFNNGTELAFYFANYHSRLPIVSYIAATQRSCVHSAASLGPGGECGYLGPGMDADNPVTPENEEPLPVDTLSVFVEYPKDIQMYGMSFNTTVGDWAWSGEYAYRPKLPTQIHSLDLALAALGPSFPDEVVNLGVVTLNQRYAFPDFVSVYRGRGNLGYENGEYIRGYEELATGQLNTTLLKLIGGDNPIGASQMTFLLEMGMNQVFDMPGLDELQFQGGGTDTPISSGADGSVGINPLDLRCPTEAPTTNLAGCANSGDPSKNVSPVNSRQNATAHKDLDGFGTSESYGYRIISLNRWDSALFGANLETLTIWQHDVKGTTPGIGTNFTEGRKQAAFGLRFDYLSKYIGEVRYSWGFGGAKRDGLRDRDNIAVSFGIQF